MEKWGVQLHAYLTSAPDEGKWLASNSGRLSRRKCSRYTSNRRLGGLRDGMDAAEEEKSLLAPIFSTDKQTIV
jgi:hypothetical protein